MPIVIESGPCWYGILESVTQPAVGWILNGGDWMVFLTTAEACWFDDGCCDVKYLDMWSAAPLSYMPGQATGPDWYTDHYEIILTHGGNGRFFQKAAHLLMRYQFYPDTILSFFGDFNLQPERHLRVGDRIVQRIHVARLFSRPFLDVIGLTEVTRVIDTPRCQGFTYVTVAPHVEQGEWSAGITWRDNGDLVLTIDAISRPSPQEPARNHRFMRALQKKAHQSGIAHFKKVALA